MDPIKLLTPISQQMMWRALEKGFRGSVGSYPGWPDPSEFVKAFNAFGSSVADQCNEVARKLDKNPEDVMNYPQRLLRVHTLLASSAKEVEALADQYVPAIADLIKLGGWIKPVKRVNGKCLTIGFIVNKMILLDIIMCLTNLGSWMRCLEYYVDLLRSLRDLVGTQI